MGLLLYADIELANGRTLSVQPGAIQAVLDVEVPEGAKPSQCIVVLSSGKEYRAKGDRQGLINGVLQGLNEITEQMQRRKNILGVS